MDSAGLLRLADKLARLDPRRPRQVNLRRALSTAYYALFHELVNGAVGRMYPDSSDQAKRLRARRGFSHAGLKSLLIQVRRPANRSAELADVFGSAPASPDLAALCETFLLAQGSREEADYDAAAWYERADVLAVVADVAAAVRSWRTIRQSPEGHRFTLALVLLGRTRRG